MITIKKRNKGVIFLGFGDSNRNFNKNGYDIWTCNDWYTFYPELEPDLIFQLHELTDDIIEKLNKQGRFLNWEEKYNQYKNKIYTKKDFDYHYAIKKFGTEFFRSTFSYMFYETINMLYSEIVLIGADLLGDTEYRTQIHGMLRNIKVARNYGIKVIAPNEEVWKYYIEMYKEECPKDFVYGFKKGDVLVSFNLFEYV